MPEPKTESARKHASRRAAEAAGPHELVGMAYDLAILACRRGDASRSAKAVLLLRKVMRSAGPEDSSGVGKFYDWCLERIRRGEFDAAAQALSDLRAAWEEAMRRFPA
jgi:hypothetical protein